MILRTLLEAQQGHGLEAPSVLYQDIQLQQRAAVLRSPHGAPSPVGPPRSRVFLQLPGYPSHPGLVKWAILAILIICGANLDELMILVGV